MTVWWDDFKTRVKTVTISYCSKRKFKLNQKYDDLKCRLENCPPGEGYAELKDQIRAMYENKYRITNIQSEIEKDLLDEKCSGYFFRRTRERRKKNLVKGVKDSEGNLVEGTDQVLDVLDSSMSHYMRNMRMEVQMVWCGFLHNPLRRVSRQAVKKVLGLER